MKELQLPPGHRLAHYEIIEMLGSGGMGQVYRARDLKLERTVALKCPHPELAQEPAFRRRFMREARAASAVSHPNIVQVFDVLEVDGLPWTVMEFVEGRTLRAILQDGRPLPVEDILRHAEGLAGALGTAHHRGILHRDIKPSNVLVDRDGRARLTDFGLAKHVIPDRGSDSATTMTVDETHPGAVVGTPGYMAPEQALGRPVDRRSDIFSLGTVLYEMCTGRPAFATSAQGDSLDAVLHREPAAIVSLNYEVPEELARIVRKCLAKSADERYQDVADMLADLRHLRRVGGSSESVEPAPNPWRLVRASAPLLVIAAAAVVVWVSVRPRPEPAPTVPTPPLSTPHQLTTTPGWEARPVLSPDGDLVAFVSSQAGSADIWMMDAGGGENPLRLTDDPAADDSPAWYPDGRFVAFRSDRGGRSSIWKVSRLGGPAMLVQPDADDPAISPDGTRLAFARRAANGFYRVWVAPLQAPENATMLTQDPDGLWDHRAPAWSPDGKELVYQDFRKLWIIPASGGRARPLTAGEDVDVDPVWSPTGRFIYFASYRERTQALWRLSPDGGIATRITMGTGPDSQPSISRDGSRLVYSTYVSDPDIRLVNQRTGTRSLVAGVRAEWEPGLSPPGDALLFVSNRLGTIDLWVQALKEGGPEGRPRRLTDLPGTLAHPRFSPDGRWIAFHRVLQGQRDIYVMPVSGGPPERITDDPAIDVEPSWSPDGTKLAYASGKEGTMRIWIAPVSQGRPSGSPRPVTDGLTTDLFPEWSPDGSSIAFIRTVNGEDDVWITSADGVATPRRLTTQADARNLAWDWVSGALLVTGTWRTHTTEIRRLNPLNRVVSQDEPPLVCGDQSADGAVAVSADGRVIAFQYQENRGDLWLLEAAPGSY